MNFQQAGKNSAYSFANVDDFVGAEIGVSDWFEITQEDTTAFGKITHDPDPNHIDPEWARENSPHGKTIAFGFQTLSLLTYLLKQLGLAPHGAVNEFNYGFDRIRWTSPVAIGERIRARAILTQVQQRTENDFLFTFSVVVEIENSEKPALVADWLVLFQNRANERQLAAS